MKNNSIHMQNMKSASLLSILLAIPIFFGSLSASGQWAFNGNHIYNTNSGNVGIGTNSPSTILYVSKNITEPTITVRNLGGNGGATFSMIDDASGANWKFKATLSGGFKIRDHNNSLDVMVIEPGGPANSIYISQSGSIGIGTSSPAGTALLDLSSNSKGLLIPRMTQVQIANIANPSGGLLVFCLDDDKFYAYTTSVNLWKEILMVP